jgi:exopolysaccharide production protein ExoZ
LSDVGESAIQPIAPVGRLVSIQCLRFAAAGLVVLTHTASGYFVYGAFGVDIFFVISGFIITHVMRQREPGPFLLDRLTRIYPLYWLFLIPMAVVGWDGDAMHLLSSVTLWPVVGEFRRSYLAVSWTLSFEMLFYLAATLILWRRRAFWVLTAFYAIAVVAQRFTNNSVLGFVGSPMIMEFLLGVVIARLPRTEWRLSGGIAIAIALCVAFITTTPSFGIIENMFESGASSRWMVWGLPAAVIVWSAMQFETMLTGRLFKFAAIGGDASYALYLSHPFFLLFAPHNPYFLLFLGTPVLFVLGIAAHFAIEKPLLKLVRRAVLPPKPVAGLSVT